MAGFDSACTAEDLALQFNPRLLIEAGLFTVLSKLRYHFLTCAVSANAKGVAPRASATCDVHIVLPWETDYPRFAQYLPFHIVIMVRFPFG